MGMSEKTTENTRPPIFDIFLIFRYLIPVAMETKNSFPKLIKILNNVDVSKHNQYIFIQIPDYAWPRYFGLYLELLLRSINKK